MAKKDTQEITFLPDNGTAAENEEQVVKSEPTLYESEAYGTSQPDEGIKTTVTKPVGIGGPVPIIAPKHNTIQLQPIVVPLAVVPYMSQDSDILRTDGRTSANPYAEGRTEEEETAFQAENARQKKHKAVRTRVYSLVMCIIAAFLFAGFMLAYFKPAISDGFDLSSVDIIGTIKGWTQGTAPADLAVAITAMVAAAGSFVALIAALFGMLFGKYPRKLFCVSSFVAVGGFIAQLLYKVIEKTFVAQNEIALLVMLGIAGLMFVVSLIFLAAAVRREDRDEELLMRAGYEI